MTRSMGWVAVIAAVLLAGCSGSRPPEVRVDSLSDAEVKARSRAGYERARARIGELEEGMRPRSVQSTLGAVTAVAGGDAEAGEAIVMDGFLCSVDPDPLHRRWLFGYDDGGLVLIGFAVEFERSDPESDRWRLQRVDRTPSDDCPDGT